MSEPCTTRAAGGQMIDAACDDCGHALLVHPGRHNPALDACVICTLLNRA